jgi:hypothetical protein
MIPAPTVMKLNAPLTSFTLRACPCTGGTSKRANLSTDLLQVGSQLKELARIFQELLSRDHKDGCATWQPQGVGFEAYLNGTPQRPTSEDARKDDHICGRSK